MPENAPLQKAEAAELMLEYRRWQEQGEELGRKLMQALDMDSSETHKSKKKTLSNSDFIAACSGGKHERVPTKRR